MIPDWTEPSPEISEEVSLMIRKGIIPAVREAEQFAAGTKAPSLKKADIRGEFTKRLSGYLTSGLVQLTFERVKTTEEFREARKNAGSSHTIVLSRLPPLTLPEYSPFITIAVRSGAAQVWKTDTAFRVQSLVTLKDTRITLHEKKFREFKFGSLNTAMSIYLKKESIEEKIHSFARDLTIPGFMAPPVR